MPQNNTRNRIISVVIGVAASIFVVYLINNFYLIEGCAHIGGKYDYDKNVCINTETYEEYYLALKTGRRD